MNYIQKRLTWVVVFFAFCLLTVALRSYCLSFRPKIQQNKTPILRGSILDRHGFTLARSEEASTISVATHEIYDSEQTAELLSKQLDMSARDILQLFYENKDKRYFYLKRQVDNFKADQIIDMHLPGIYREREYRRFYPGKSLASNVLGFVGQDQNLALAGIERSFNNVLLQTNLKNKIGMGYNLQLTLDSFFQYNLEQELGKAFAKSSSKRGAGILMDIETGAILAMASYPNFDPNFYYKSTPIERSNWNIRLNYEPGSTMKIFMAAILLQEEVIQTNQKFLCDGELHFFNTVVRCRAQNSLRGFVKHGYVDLYDIIEKSCNVGIIKAMQKVKPERLFYYLQKLGFGQLTEILPSGSGETNGYFPPLNTWVASTPFYMPIGQGFSVTPIQLLTAGASLANNGKLLRPFLAWRIRSPEDNITLNEQRIISKPNPFEKSINIKVQQMMQRVVSRGTGVAARIDHIGAIGKTGTGEKSSAKGYLDKYVVSFLGFFPEKKPKYGVLILFDEPIYSYNGSLVASGSNLAAPVFGNFVKKILPYISSKSTAVRPENLPEKTIHHWNVRKDILYDFRSLAARDALEILNDYYNLKVELHGDGYVYKQDPLPGTKTEGLDTIKLYLSELQ